MKWILLLTGMLAGEIFAQLPSATLSGTALDQSQAAASGVRITAEEENTARTKNEDMMGVRIKLLRTGRLSRTRHPAPGTWSSQEHKLAEARVCWFLHQFQAGSKPDAGFGCLFSGRTYHRELRRQKVFTGCRS